MNIHSTITLVFCLFYFSSFSQTKIEWQPDYQLSPENFKGNAPQMEEDNFQRYYFACQFDFQFQMNNYQFMATKNFNKYVKTYFYPDASWLEKGENTNGILLFCNLQFDITELYARKFRKQMYDNKKAFSVSYFYQKEYEIVHAEYVKRISQIDSEIPHLETEERRQKIKDIHQQILIELEALADFCKECKPQKKKKSE